MAQTGQYRIHWISASVALTKVIQLRWYTKLVELYLRIMNTVQPHNLSSIFGTIKFMGI